MSHFEGTTWHEWREAPPAEFGVIGDPIGHSLSPRMQMAAFSALGLPHRYEAIRVPLEEFDSAAAHLLEQGYRGLNVTVPLKERAFAWAHTKDLLTERIQAANTLDLFQKRATNTDAPGILDVFAELGIAPGANVLLIGAGGAARGVAAALAHANFPFSVTNRSREKAEGMLAELGIPARVMSAPDPAGFEVILNATSAELAGTLLSVDWTRATPGAWAIDLVYSEGPTQFMASALAAGLNAADGRRLLVAQGARSLEWWLGVEAPRSVMLNAIL